MPFLTLSSLLSFHRGHENLHKYAKYFNYHYLMMLGSEEQIVGNEKAMAWHRRTPSTLEKEVHVFQGYQHQLH